MTGRHTNRFNEKLNISSYQTEQLHAWEIVQRHMMSLDPEGLNSLFEAASGYLDFRVQTQGFQKQYFSDICREKCFDNRRSACCSKEGIIVFFADIVVNCLVSTAEEINDIKNRLETVNRGTRCIYLGELGCMWRMPPIVCLMFLCSEIKNLVLTPGSEALEGWQDIAKREKTFTWPDKPVLFDYLEHVWMCAGYDSGLMHCHKSPGLLRVKKKACARSAFF